MSPLVDAGYRVVRLDQRGHGESSALWPDYGSPRTGEDMIALIRHLDEPAVIIGHSSSAAAAIWAAAGEPALVTAAVVIGPFARQRELSPLMRFALAVVTSRATIWSRRYYPTMYKAPKPADFATYVRALQANLREPGRMAATRGAMSRQVECYDRAAEVRCPLLVVMGSRDPDFSDPAAEAAYAQRLLGAHTAASVAIIDGAGHYPHAELPDATAAAVLSFLAGVVDARAGLSTDSVVDAAVALVDDRGAAALTLAAVAARTGVAAPSLYKHVRNLEALQQKVSCRVTTELAQALSTAVAGRAGLEALRAAAHAFRNYALAHPGRYPLTQRVPDAADLEHVAAGEQAVQAVFAALRGYGIDGDEAIHATRVTRSALHGFVSLDIAGGFGMPQEVGQTFERLIAVLHLSLTGWRKDGSTIGALVEWDPPRA